jgi:serine protease Do
LPDGTNGLVVAAVDASSDAATKGLQRGDIVLSANYREVRTVADLETAVRSAQSENRQAVLLRVQRRGQPPAYLPIRLR